MSLVQNEVTTKCFNRDAKLPFGLRLKDFEMAMQDVYDFFYDVNLGHIERGLQRLDDMLRPAILSGVLYDVDNSTEPAKDRAPMTVTEIYLGQVTKNDFRKNQRSELGTRTATLHKDGIDKLRKSWVYKLTR